MELPPLSRMTRQSGITSGSLSFAPFPRGNCSRCFVCECVYVCLCVCVNVLVRVGVCLLFVCVCLIICVFVCVYLYMRHAFECMLLPLPPPLKLFPPFWQFRSVSDVENVECHVDMCESR